MTDLEHDFDQVHPEERVEARQAVFVDKKNAEASNWWIGGWLSPILAAGFTAFWGLLIYALIGMRPTYWQYGVVPYVPAQSYLTSQEPSLAKVPPQIQLPPEVRKQSVK